jgi:luciferase family oxidoreductase group 1
MTALSVLDQGPVSARRGPAAVLADAVALARHVEDLGYARYWFAEHHATPSVGISAPDLAVAHVAAATRRLRVGAGGMMLPNHAPLQLVERFRTLEALHPGRIDLGIGRSHGTTHPPTVAALARSGVEADTFAAGLREVLTLGSGGARPGADGAGREHRADGPLVVPEEIPLPPVFLLGASVSSARLAARLRLGYAFLAAYQDPAVAVAALRTYRADFPVGDGPGPHAILTLTIVVGTDDAHAQALAAPWRLALAHHAIGSGRRLLDVDELGARRPTAAELAAERRPPLNDRRTEIVGDPRRVTDAVRGLVETTGADEILAVTNIPDPTERLRSYERLADIKY